MVLVCGDGSKVNRREAEESQFPIESLEEGLEDEDRIVLSIPNGT